MFPKFAGVKKVFIAFILVYGIVPITSVYSQKSIDSLRTYFTDFRYFANTVSQMLLQNDTIFESIYFYDNLKKETISLPRTGNVGSASFNPFEYDASGKIFTDGFDQYSPYSTHPLKKFPSEHGERRYSNIDYHLGSKKEQHILISHEQKIRPWMIAGLSFGALQSTGDFARQLNKNRSFDVWYAYQSQANTYRAFVSFTSGKVENQENGGITTDSLFEEASSLDTKTIDINLQSATMRHKNRDFVVKQDINLTNLFSKADTSEKLADFNQGSLVLSNSFWWHRKSVLFTSQNPDSGYFENIYIDSTATFDSSFYNDVYNQAMLEYTSPLSENGSSFSVGGGVNYQLVDYFSLVGDTSINSVMVVGTGGFKTKNLNARLVYSKSVAGDFDKSFEAQLTINYILNSIGDEIFLNLNASNKPQSLHDRIYLSNHFVWINNFEPEDRMEAAAGFNWSKYKIGLSGRVITARNMVFYREDYLPQTNSDYVSFGEAVISKTWRFGKFGMDDKLTLGFSGNESIVRLPGAAVYGSFYYTNRLFKNALGFKAGLDISWQSEYYAYGFMPATGVFYLQNEQKIGNYPMAGIFVGMRIKTANIFMRLDHLNSGISSRTYYGAYHYPMPGRTFKLGVSWDLFD